MNFENPQSKLAQVTKYTTIINNHFWEVGNERIFVVPIKFLKGSQVLKLSSHDACNNNVDCL